MQNFWLNHWRKKNPKTWVPGCLPSTFFVAVDNLVVYVAACPALPIKEASFSRVLLSNHFNHVILCTSWRQHEVEGLGRLLLPVCFALSCVRLSQYIDHYDNDYARCSFAKRVFWLSFSGFDILTGDSMLLLGIHHHTDCLLFALNWPHPLVHLLSLYRVWSGCADVKKTSACWIFLAFWLVLMAQASRCLPVSTTYPFIKLLSSFVTQQLDMMCDVTKNANICVIVNKRKPCTENHFANRSRGLGKIRNYHWKRLEKAHLMVFCLFSAATFCGFIFDNSLNSQPIKIGKTRVDAEFWANFSFGLQCFVAFLTCRKNDFFTPVFRNCFLQNQ